MKLDPDGLDGMHVISLGAGVQSSAMALMAAEGRFSVMPEVAIFADTQAEPRSVYDWLDWLELRLPFPVVRVSRGNLAQESVSVHTKGNGDTWVKGGVPYFSRGDDGRPFLMPRRCTADYKIAPINAWCREHRKGRPVVTWIGISVDEAVRMKPSRSSGFTSVWPLVSMGIDRDGCLSWMRDRGYPRPPRSACVFCPFHSSAEWRRLKDGDPDAFEAAARYEEQLQSAHASMTGFRGGLAYLHKSLVPLRDVDLSTEHERGQMSLFDNECEGMCGV